MLQSLRSWARPLFASNQMRGVMPAFHVVGLSLTAAMVTAAAGYADVVSVPPRIVVVEKDATPMRCGSSTPLYVVHTLNAGQQLRVDGEEDGWLRVEYLTGMLAFVKAEEATLEEDGKSVRLTRPSRLSAVNDRGNERGHWWSLLDAAMPAESTLSVHETIKAMNEVTVGYLVVAPAGARGYVKADAVRSATKEEVAGFVGRTDVEVVKAAAAAEGQAGAVKDSDEKVAEVEGPPPVDVIHDMSTLKTRYAQVMALKGDAARKEIPVAIAEFKRTAATLGSSKEDGQLKSAIDRGISALQLRQDILSALKTYS